ncbi:hypothetical protein J437_LFUL002288 [Ladona fulva]|uniref:ZP domain-containing protein n=1 Tax=Ladona fulva TaxID=123851 RepID=A0A8K0NWT0_LADFU|nr:hypothetical protein J437_LFUL002288 [Ladona fulva]
MAAAQLQFDDHPVQPPGNALETIGLVPNGVRGGGRALTTRQNNEVGHHDHHHHHTHVDMIDIKCDSRGMLVTVEFSGPFDGIIYSKGHFGKSRCRYVEPGSGRSSYTFTIPLNDCGTTPSGGFGRTVDNVIEIWDTARKISCATTERKEKTVIFKPFVVDMLEVVNVPVSTGNVNCWMDIRRGEYPNVIKIGETLTILVYLKDEENLYDLRVRDCWAYDGEDYESPETNKLQLTDTEGCPKKQKLIHFWRRTYQTGKSGASVIAFNNITAFKFPDKMQVFLTCNIETVLGLRKWIVHRLTT